MASRVNIVMKEVIILELLQLKYFCHAAETENFSETAKRFYVPASNISQSIKRLESELNVTLFTRRANRIRLNETGRDFYKKVKHALSLLESAVHAAQDSRERKTIRICIMIQRSIVMSAIEKFQKQHPDFNFITTHTTPNDIYDYDLVVTDANIDCDFTKTLIAQESFVLAYNKNFFSFPNEPAVVELKDQPFIVMNKGSSVFENLNTICTDLGFTPHIVLQSEDPFYIRKCIEFGLGISIIPELSWRGLFSENIEFKTIGDYNRKTYVYQKNSENESLKDFYNTLISTFRNIIQASDDVKKVDFGQ